MKFVITGLPRTRSAWFAAYFSDRHRLCYHEAIGNKIDLKPNEGTADCGYTLSPTWVKRQGEHKLVIIHRDPADVSESLQSLGYRGYEFEDLAARLNDLHGLHIDYENIDAHISAIHGYLNIPFNKKRAELFKSLHIVGMKYK